MQIIICATKTIIEQLGLRSLPGSILGVCSSDNCSSFVVVSPSTRKVVESDGVLLLCHTCAVVKGFDLGQSPPVSDDAVELDEWLLINPKVVGKFEH
jgi:hypothetical protein